MNSRTSTAGGLGHALLFLCILFAASPTTVRSQARVTSYIVEQFDGGMTWDWSAPYTYLGWSDNTYYSVALPFAFSYDGNTVAANSTVRVSTNGWIQFTLPGYNPNGLTTSYNLLGNSSYRNMIQYFGANLYPSGGVYHQTTGTSPSRVWTVYYPSVRYQASSAYPYVSMMLKLYEEDGKIEFLYSSNNLYMGSTAVNAGIGLNGHAVPSYQSRTLEMNVDYTPTRNWRMRPPKPSRPQLSVSMASVEFGEALVGDAPVTACITVSNVGTSGEPGADNSPLTFTGTNLLTTNDFELTGNPTQALYPGESKDYCITFSPLNMGVLSAGLDIRTNGVDSGMRVIPIKGFGLAGKMNVPAEYLFRKTRTKVGQELTQNVAVMNEGNYPMTVLSATPMGEFADQYSIALLPPDPIQPGETGYIHVRYNAIYEGLTASELEVVSDAAFEPLDRVQLWGFGIIPRLVITSDLRGVDSISIGDTALYTFRLENIGTDTLLIKQDYFSSADPDFYYLALIGADSIILPNQYREVSVRFAPRTRGVRHARLRLTTNIPKTLEASARDTSEFNLDFTLVGVPAGLLSVEAADHGSSLVGVENCQQLAIYNFGLEPLSVNSVAITGANAAEFEFASLDLPLTIGANDSIVLQLCATAADRGPREAEVTVAAESNGKFFSQVLPVTVTGQIACAAPDMASAFDGELVKIGTTKNAAVTITNCGDVPTTYNAAILGAGYMLVGPASSDAIAPGASHTYEISFTPTSMALMPATLTVTGNAIQNIDIPLNGTGGTYTLNILNANAGDVGVGDRKEFDVTVTNSGNMDWMVGTPAVDASEFTIVSSPASVSAGTSAVFTFAFAPTEEGARTGNVTFAGESFAIVLTGVGVVAGVGHEADGYALSQNFPNPFNGSTVINFTMAKAGYAKIVVSDITGKVVAVAGEGYYERGENRVTVHLPGAAGGSYLYELIADDVKLQRAMRQQ